MKNAKAKEIKLEKNRKWNKVCNKRLVCVCVCERVRVSVCGSLLSKAASQFYLPHISRAGEKSNGQQ